MACMESRNWTPVRHPKCLSLSFVGWNPPLGFLISIEVYKDTLLSTATCLVLGRQLGSYSAGVEPKDHQQIVFFLRCVLSLFSHLSLSLSLSISISQITESPGNQLLVFLCLFRRSNGSNGQTAWAQEPPFFVFHHMGPSPWILVFFFRSSSSITILTQWPASSAGWGVEVDKTCRNSTHPVHENAVGCFAVLMSILQLGCHTRKNIPLGPLHRHTHTH